jgi:hypothetical protein
MGDHLTFAVEPQLSPRPHHHLETDAPSIRAVTNRKVVGMTGIDMKKARSYAS